MVSPLPLLVGEFLALALLLVCGARVWTSSRHGSRFGRLAWTSLAIIMPLVGFLAFLLAVEYRRDARLHTN